ncbi:unnamed protein product [Cuscuta europaea]|uniref:Uncharacterized protein n=1 Tax=Cuscuta europaea TaxID=41803 RepID=A0A9P0ZBY5_CUSEU|nr:unnamed protein product [Cuscuta europaea]
MPEYLLVLLAELVAAAWSPKEERDDRWRYWCPRSFPGEEASAVFWSCYPRGGDPQEGEECLAKIRVEEIRTRSITVTFGQRKETTARANKLNSNWANFYF